MIKKYFFDNNMGTVLWFTGLSGAGKTTLAKELKVMLEAQGKRVYMLDGDEARLERKHLGFTREDVKENNRLLAEAAKDMVDRFDFILVSVISPYSEDRKMAKKIIGPSFIEMFLNCPLEECIRRDTKGLYKKAINGKIDNLIGFSVSNPYEPPRNSDFEVKTSECNIEESANKIIMFLKNRGNL